MTTINSEFGTFNISSSTTSISATGPDGFSFQGEPLTGIDSLHAASWNAVYLACVQSCNAKIHDMRQAQILAVITMQKDHVASIDTHIESIDTHIASIDNHIAAIDSNVAILTDRGSDEHKGIFIRGQDHMSNFARSMTVVALNDSKKLDAVKREMARPTFIPGD